MAWPSMAACMLMAALLGPVVALEPAQREGSIVTEEGSTIESIGRTVQVVFRTQLTGPEGQWVNAVSAGLVGLMLLAVDCRMVFKWFGVGSVAMFVMLLAMHEVKARWSFGFEHGASPIVGVEAALFSAWAALRGYRGLMVLVGAFLGLFLAHLVRALCYDLGYKGFERSDEQSLALFSLFVLGGIGMVSRKAHMLLLVYVNPFLGGALASSAVCWGLTAIWVKGYASTWLDSLLLLCSGNSWDVDLFAGPHHRWCGIALWFAFFVMGAMRQEDVIRRQKAVDRAAQRQATTDEPTN